MVSAMAAYSFSALSDIRTIAQAHERRGFHVLVVGMAWQGVQGLAKTLGMASAKDRTMVVTSLARQIHEKAKKGGSVFAQPTLVVVGDDGHLGEAAVAWGQIQQAANASGSEVVFAHLPMAG